MPEHHHSDLWAIPPHMAEDILRQIHASPETVPTVPAGSASGTLLPVLSATLNTSPEQEPDPGYAVQNGIAVIPVSGTITRVGYRHWYTGQILTQGQDVIRSAMTAALADASVRGILLSFNSPGGEVPGTKELADFVAESAQTKPCAAYVNGLCASAAFWLASATGRILSPATGTVGSIGVIMVHADCSRWNERAGIVHTSITSGKWKDAGNENRPLSDEDKAYFAERVATIHGLFKADVQSRLNLAAPESAWAEAQLFLAEEARTLGLVSAIVRDEAEAVTTLFKETIMDKTTFKAQHPQLLAEITAEAKLEAEAQTHKQMQGTLAVVRAVVSEEQYAAISSVIELCANSGLSPDQMTAIAPVLAAKAAPAQPVAPTAPLQPTGEQAAMTTLLQALQAATPQPLAVDPKTTHPAAKSTLVVDAERRSHAAKE